MMMDVTQLPSSLREITVTADSARYPSLRSSYMRVGSPAGIVMARNDADVAAAVRFAGEQAIPLAVRSGGHGIAGRSTNHGGMVLDLSAINDVEVTNPAAGHFAVGAGAHWGHVSAALEPHELVMTSGNFGDTGVGGLATSGGVGYLVRQHGMTVDHLRAATIVLADGTVHRVDSETEPELFWAIRGAGSMVGVVTNFEFSGIRLPRNSIIHATVVCQAASLAKFLQTWQDFMLLAPRELTSFLQIQQYGPRQFVIESRYVWANDDVAAASPWLDRAMKLDSVVQQEAQVTSYRSIIPTPNWPHTGQQRIHMRNAYVARLDAATAEAVEALFADPLVVLAEVRSVGGAVNDMPAGATAFAHRHQEALVAAWTQPAAESLIDDAWAPVAALADGLYSSYTSDVRPARAVDAFPGDTWARLAALRAEVDPGELFSAGIAVPPAQ
ncbi:FAD-binding oxidoreductase [Arthrobacter psychrolactophilus]